MGETEPSTDTRRTHLLLVGQLLVLLGQDLGEVQVAHLRVDFGVFGAFLHEEAKVRRQRLLREIRVSLGATGGVGSENARRETLERTGPDPVLTFSFLPLYGFFTKSMASTMSSVIVRYLRT